MGIMEIIGMVGGVVGVAGIIYTIYYGRRSQRKKLLVYEISRSIALAQAFSPEDDYKLSVLFQRKGSTAEKIESVFTTFLKFANLGKESIRGSDIAPANPIRVNIKGARTLDIQVAGITRKVNNVSLKNQVKKGEQASVNVNFEFLDYQDGALIKILSVGNKGKISLTGDIIGMPEGIKNIEEIGQRTRKGGVDVSGWFFLGLIIAGLILSGFIFYWVTGSWRNVWLLFVPLGILVILIAILFIVETWSWPRGVPPFPISLDLPKWCRSFPFYPSIMLRSELLAMEMEEKSDAIEEEVKRTKNKKGES